MLNFFDRFEISGVIEDNQVSLKFFPQIVFAGENKKAIGWFPGKYQQSKTRFEWCQNKAKYIGFTGRYYQDFALSKDIQEYYRLWVGIDIDDIVSNDLEKIKKVCKGAMEIRSSLSGEGVHVIYRTSPLIFDGKDSKAVKKVLEPIVKKLEEEGIKVCKYDGNVFYTYGGNQEILYESESPEILKLDKSFEEALHNQNNQDNHNEYYSLEDLSPVGKRLLGTIRTKDPEYFFKPSQGIYIKAWYNLLKGTDFEFETKSPMKSDTFHINGMAFVRGRTFNIWSHCDGVIVASYLIFL